MSDQERRELVTRIERGEYVTYETPKYPLKNNVITVLVLAAVYFALWLVQAILRNASFGQNILVIIEKVFRVYFYIALGIFVLLTIFWLVGYFRKKSKVYDLGKLSANNKKLILQGECIEADLGSTKDTEKGAIINCSADYGGQNLHFESPAIRAQVLPFDEHKILVFIDKNNPQNYLVDIYSHIPRKGPKVLSNRDDLKLGEESDEEHWRRIVLSIFAAIMIIFFWPLMLGLLVFVLAPLAEAIIALVNNDMSSFGGFGMFLILEIAVVLFVRYKLKQSGAIKRGSRAWRPSDFYLGVIVDKYWTTEYVVRGEDGKKTHKVHHISATYIDPQTKYMYIFTVTGPRAISNLQGKEVRVYVNPNNMYKYYVDYPTALQNNKIKYDNTGFTFDDNGVWYEK